MNTAAARAAAAAKAAATSGSAMKAVGVVGTLGVFAGRRALWPGLVLGGAAVSAGWFGAFELVFSASKAVLPVPAEADTSAQVAGVATIPFSGGGVLLIGHKIAPPTAALPTSVVDLPGLFGFVRSLPVGHYATAGLVSASVAAVCCRAVQWKGGA
uniref:Uncharacterized protein n=1 Tax=Haptolina brevifila TaxID=156173 RepID=A0A7S2I8R3_9EUKA|mmetsp:Transcript_62934/g.124372  ORF Transcript_62934/g.124372 Transcript_62934/m.124372 type:complete len:156 (+) Transcript_62934:29-496(+)